jgi:hypothetical protein
LRKCSLLTNAALMEAIRAAQRELLRPRLKPDRRAIRWAGLLPVEQVQRVVDMLRAIVERGRLDKAA